MPRFHTGKTAADKSQGGLPGAFIGGGANGDQESHLLHPLDISDHGVKLGGVQAGFNIGEIIEIQYRHNLAKFREWYGSGAECTEPDRNPWDVELPTRMDEYRIASNSQGRAVVR